MSTLWKCILLLAVASAAAHADESNITQLSTAARAGDRAALVQLKMLADRGQADAQSALGDMYTNGDGVPKDAAQAMNWWKKAADHGNASAQNSLGLAYAYARDFAQAANWFRKAADQGYVGGQLMLGWIYEKGEGVPKDFVIAYSWYNLAAAQGDPVAKGDRDRLAEQMTPAQIADAQKMSREWRPRK